MDTLEISGNITVNYGVEITSFDVIPETLNRCAVYKNNVQQVTEGTTLFKTVV